MTIAIDGHFNETTLRHERIRVLVDQIVAIAEDDDNHHESQNILVLASIVLDEIASAKTAMKKLCDVVTRRAAA